MLSRVMTRSTLIGGTRPFWGIARARATAPPPPPAALQYDPPSRHGRRHASVTGSVTRASRGQARASEGDRLRWGAVLETRKATARVVVPARAIGLGQLDTQRALVLLTPCLLLVAGGLLGYPFALDEAGGRERLLGLILASALAITTTLGLTHLKRVGELLIGASIAALAA